MRYFSKRFDASIVGGFFMSADDVGGGRSTVEIYAERYGRGNLTLRPRGGIGRRGGAVKPTDRPNGGEE